MSARGQPRPPIVPGPGPATCPGPCEPAGSAAGVPAPLCHPLLHVTPRPASGRPQAAGSPPSLPAPRGKSSARRACRPRPPDPPASAGKLGQETASLATSCLSGPFNYSGAGWRRRGCRSAARGAGRGAPALPPRAPPRLRTLPCAAELAGLSFPEFQMTAAWLVPVWPFKPASFWSPAGGASSGHRHYFNAGGDPAAARGAGPACLRGGLVKFLSRLRKGKHVGWKYKCISVRLPGRTGTSKVF